MKVLFASPQPQELELLRNALEKAAIQCEVRNQNVSAFFPGAEFYPELWVLNDADSQRAAELRDGLLKAQSQGANTWLCRVYGEESEGQFTSCWKCGAMEGSGETNKPEGTN